MEVDTVTGRIIAAAIEVHRELGPGLLEPSYQACLSWELMRRGPEFEPRNGCRSPLNPVHAAQVLPYLRLTACPMGLLLNFNVRYLKDGLRRFVSPCSP